MLPLLLWQSAQAQQFPDKYDSEFKAAARFLPPGTDWRLLKAQCYQESRLKPNARSPVGAMGLCQFMPNTWREMQQKHGFSNPWRPEQSIRAAAVYMAQLNKSWSSPRPQADRYMLALASYNAGFGNILAAQRECGMPVLYSEIVPPCLGAVTGHHSKETRGYVRNIMGRWWPAMILGD